MRSTLLSLMLVASAGLVVCSPAHAERNPPCIEKWDYRVVQIEDQEALTKRGNSRRQAGLAIQQTLNRLGNDGWEIASAHELAVVEEVDERGRVTGVATFRPNAVLFKRKVSFCTGDTTP